MITNKKLNDYKHVEKYIAGMCLSSSQLSDIKHGRCELTASWVDFSGATILLRQVKFNGNETELQLLLNKTEIAKIQKHLIKEGYTVIPSKIVYTEAKHSNKKFYKIEIVVVIGMRKWDKREQIKNRENEIKLKRLVK